MNKIITTLFFLATLTSSCSRENLSQLTDDREVATLRVLSYNAYLLSADATGKASLDKRLALLARELEKTNADIILMQELWGDKVRTDLVQSMKSLGYESALKEKKSWWPPYFYGNGLGIFYRNSLSPQTPPNNFVFDKMLNFDRFTNKGALKITLNSPAFGTIDVVSAHASYLKFDHDTNSYDLPNEPTMIGQTKEIASFLKNGNAPIKILGADMNTHPLKWSPATSTYIQGTKSGVYGEFTDRQGLKDAVAEGPEPHCAPNCFTWDNTNKLLSQGIFTGTRAEPDARLDYVLYKGESISVRKTQLALLDLHNMYIGNEIQKLPLSDHYGVLVEFTKAN